MQTAHADPSPKPGETAGAGRTIRLGATFPQTEIGADPAAIRDYAQAVEEMGYTHIVTFDHVVGANVNRPDRQGQRWPYTSDSQFHEPFVLFSYLAGITTRVEFCPGVIILPQRQTVLVAKQAAALDVLSGGRLRLGVGVGWNAVEYEALGMEFHNRGPRMAEQIRLMRRLWSQPLVTFEGKWHRVPDAGINPLPARRSIPLWIGGAQGEGTEVVLRRIGRLADGWMLVGSPGPHTAASWDRIRDHAHQAGRDPASLGLEGGIPYGDGNLDRIGQVYETWQRLGATHACVGTMGAKLKSPGDHIAALRRVKEALPA